MEQPLISVIVPVYKAEKYICQCIESILNQTYENLEIILVDDNYPCECSDICDVYAVKDERVVVIHQENSGVSKARNVALDCCRGEYIAFVDSDDWIEETAYEDMMSMMKENDLDVVFCTANIITDEKITENRFCFFDDGYITKPEELVELSLKDEIGGQMWMKLWHRRCWDKVRFPEGRIYEDLAISYLPFTYAVKNIGFLRKPLYNYRMNETGISFSENPRKAYNIFLAFKEHYAYAKEKCKKSEDVCLCKTVNFAMGTYNRQVIGKDEKNETYICEIKKWLKENILNIKKCKEISLLIKISVLTVININTVYDTVYIMYYRIRRNIRGKR